MSPLSSPRMFKSHDGLQAFSLVEIVLALGIVSFAMVSIFGLIPVGLTTFRQAKNLSVEANIAQQLASDVQRSDFQNLGATNFTFDEQGIAVSKDKAIFTVLMEAPGPVDAAGVLRSNAAARTVLIKISHRASPAVTNCYPVVIPSGL